MTNRRPNIDEIQAKLRESSQMNYIQTNHEKGLAKTTNNRIHDHSFGEFDLRDQTATSSELPVIIVPFKSGNGYINVPAVFDTATSTSIINESYLSRIDSIQTANSQNKNLSTIKNGN